MNQLNNYGVSERFFTEATLYPEYQLARVIAQYRGKYKIVTEQGEMLAEISGKLRYDTEELAQYPAVGDCVMVDFKSSGILFDVRGIPEVTVDDADIALIQPGDFVLFRTGQMEEHPYGDPLYFENHPQLSHELVEVLTEKKIRFIGVDCPGIRQHSEHETADRFCEQHGGYIIENLKNLEQIHSQRFTVYTMWLEDEVMTGLRCKVIAECLE